MFCVCPFNVNAIEAKGWLRAERGYYCVMSASATNPERCVTMVVHVN